MDDLLDLKEEVLRELIRSMDRIILKQGVKRAGLGKRKRARSAPPSGSEDFEIEDEEEEEEEWFPALERMLSAPSIQE